jgi:hypothetical protein
MVQIPMSLDGVRGRMGPPARTRILALAAGVAGEAAPTRADAVADELSERYGRGFDIDAEPTRDGVPARASFEAAGSGVEYATYAQVGATLDNMLGASLGSA